MWEFVVGIRANACWLRLFTPFLFLLREVRKLKGTQFLKSRFGLGLEYFFLDIGLGLGLKARVRVL